MLNAEGSAGVSSASRAQYMRAGSFFGAIQGKREQCGAIFTDLRHAAPRKLPMHSHEIGPRGVRLYEIEIRPRWQKCLADCSAALDTPRDDIGGGPLLWLCMKLFREVQASTAADDLAVESLVAEILSFAARACQQENRHVPGWLSRIQDKLRTEHCRRLTLDELAREAGVHPVHLSRIFRRSVGEGIGDHIHRLRVRTACERLLDPCASLAEISFATGFADQSHFARSFRRITGMTPGTFRSVVLRST